MTTLADRIAQLAAEYPDEWRVEKEPHDYKDGTRHFNHVRFTSGKHGVDVEVASYVTPDLAELLCLLHNNLPAIVHALKGFPGQRAAQGNYDAQGLGQQGGALKS